MNADQPLLVPLPLGDLEKVVAQYLEKIGVPISTIRAEALSRVSDRPPEVVRILFDYFDQVGGEDFDQHSETCLPGQSDRLLIHMAQRSIRRRNEAALYFSERLPSFTQRARDIARYWYVSPKVLSAMHLPLWAIDSRSRWPSWIFVGTPAQFEFRRPESTTVRSAEGLQALEEDVFGAHRDPYPGLLPSVVIRIQQRLVRLADNRLLTDGPAEGIDLRFEVGENADGFLRRDRLWLHYAFYSADGKSFARDEVDLDIRRNGPRIQVRGPAGTKIMRADVELYLGDALIDWSTGGYIREIRLNVSVI